MDTTRKAKGVKRVRVVSRRVISLVDMAEEDAERLLAVLKNDLQEYEALDEDFSPGTERTLRLLVEELDKCISSREEKSV